MLIGGAAGAVSRITGTIGKGLAALTFDDEYQKKRREGLNKKPANIGEGFARGGKGLVMVSEHVFYVEVESPHNETSLFNKNICKDFIEGEGEVTLRNGQGKHL